MITDTNIINTSVKKYPLLTRVVFFLSVFLLCTSLIIVHAETITYDVCGSGCEYATLHAIENDIYSLEYLGDKDIVININSILPSKTTDSSNNLNVGSENNMTKSLTINGNNHTIDTLHTYTNKLEVRDLVVSDESSFYNSDKIIVTNSNSRHLGIFYKRNNEIDNNEHIINDILEIDSESFNNIKMLGFNGNIKIENLNLKNILLYSTGGVFNIYNSQFGKLLSLPLYSDVSANLYNCTFDSFKYKNIYTYQLYINEFGRYMNSYNTSSLNYDIYVVNVRDQGLAGVSETNIYFDKELEVETNETKKLVDILDYYTNDKKIDYTIEDETIAKIENKELIGLKEGQTNVTVTTDDGHVVYRIKLNVIKETIVEKIDNKTVEIPITGIKIKLWILIILVLLFGIVGVGLYTLIKDKKKK